MGDHSIKDRSSNRLPGYDYAQPGAYFVTICVQNRAHRLGSVMNDGVTLSKCGSIAAVQWQKTMDHFEHAVLDMFVIMPNHLHAIIEILPPRRGGVTPPLRQEKEASLGDIVAHYKYQTTKSINLFYGTPGLRFWQRNYYDHIIRSEADLNRCREYILQNPLRWEHDRYFT